MKKSLSIIALFLFIGAQSHAQKQMIFKMLVKPNYHYDMVMNMNMNMEMNISGDSATINQIKSGQSFPMIMNAQSAVNGDIKTGLVNAVNKIPFTMTMKTLASKMNINGKENPMPVPATSTVMYGTYTADGKMNLDSIAGTKATDEIKNSMTTTIKGIQAIVKFPEKPMKIGDSFTQDTPMDLPIADMQLKLISKTTYKLTAIEDNIAYFDAVYDITMDVAGNAAGMAMAMNMTGDGDGKLVFDIKANYPTSIKKNMNINYNMTMPQAAGVKMDGKMKMLMDMKTTISSK
ncbi:hypothetical protein BDD43_1275 [Mucilaginibacter gracilis]|uniref:Uncharacterized protein n=1 Tax=Mucilaginibacter gracilis TaxID=423350 RepID=A0A495IXM0_9SPHI|nr:hypothetical protein [Mucilaginibacter gracilis]RKR81131.1 hypothetical protein BDD43_1275 [Mucilaginibacter gracilis]